MCKIKRIMLIVMAAALILASMALPASAASVDEMTDVKPSAWYYDHVKKAMELGYFGGTSETTFEPEGKMTRAMFVQALANAADVDLNKYPGTSFYDVKATDWYAAAINWAVINGVTSGTGGNKFSPNAALTREQMVTLLYNFAKTKGLDSLLQFPEYDLNTDFTDINSVSSWAKGPMTWAVAKKILSGSDRKLDPQGVATRAQTATILVKCKDWLAYEIPTEENPDEELPEEEQPEEEQPKPEEPNEETPEVPEVPDTDGGDHIHDWVFHEAVTEERLVADAWTEYDVKKDTPSITICNQCGEQFTGPGQESEAGRHIVQYNSNCHGYHTIEDNVYVISNPIQHQETFANVETKPAYYECSLCGEIKPNKTHEHTWEWVDETIQDYITWHAYRKPISEIIECQSYLCFNCSAKFHEHELGSAEAAMLAAVAHIQESTDDECVAYGKYTKYDRNILGYEEIPDQITKVVTCPAHLECTDCGESFA